MLKYGNVRTCFSSLKRLQKRTVPKASAIVGSQLLLCSTLPARARCISTMNKSARILINFSFSFFLSLTAKAAPAGDTPGVPWQGSYGITQSVDKIMAAEEEDQRSPQTFAFRTTHRRSVPARSLQHNPLSPAVSQWPVGSPSSSGAGSPSPFIPQIVGSSFLGAQISDTLGYIPPDSMGTVGPSQVLVIVNGRVKVFSKSGTLGPLNADTDVFFSPVTSAGTSDPHVRYDRLSQRWFITMIDLATPNHIVIAVSSGPTITGTASFTFFQFQQDLVGTTPNSDTGGFADYDTLGVDKFALYIGANIYNAAGNAVLGTTGFVVNKANLLAGTLTVTPFRQLGSVGGSGGGTGTAQGEDNDDPKAN